MTLTRLSLLSFVALLALASTLGCSSNEPSAPALTEQQQLALLLELLDERDQPPPMTPEEIAERQRLAEELRRSQDAPSQWIPTPTGWLREGEIYLPMNGLFRPIHLKDSTWVAAGETASFAAFLFLETMLVVTTIDAQVLSFPADFTGNHPACRGVRSCVVTIEQPPAVTPWFFAMVGGLLVQLECRSEGEELNGERAHLPELREALGSAVIFDENDTICWNSGGTPWEMVVASAPTPPPAQTFIPLGDD
jgi:hypothetical protein